jgi:hypothetical protein
MNHKQKGITFICVQPSILYYAWQVEVMLKNFEQLGIHKHDVRCLFAYNKNEPDWEVNLSHIKKLESTYSHIAKFFFYQDTREYPISYISSIRPNILKQHYKEFPELSETSVFYHDCDIVFTSYPNFIDNISDDSQWYVSDTKSYIGHNYIISKGEDVLDKMCEIVGISKEIVKEKQNESGGAQYIIRGVDYNFFEKVEKDAERLFKEINILNSEKKRIDPTHHELQIWCADMWALLWNAWILGYTTNIIPEMDFCWATDDVSQWDKRYIFHNAGVTHQISSTHFFKGDFRNITPYKAYFGGYNKNVCSYKYAEIVQNVGLNSCLL